MALIDPPSTADNNSSPNNCGRLTKTFLNAQLEAPALSGNTRTHLSPFSDKPGLR
jgi:hypothetical protein